MALTGHPKGKTERDRKAARYLTWMAEEGRGEKKRQILLSDLKHRP